MTLLADPDDYCWTEQHNKKLIIMPGQEVIYSTYKIENTSDIDLEIEKITIMLSGGFIDPTFNSNTIYPFGWGSYRGLGIQQGDYKDINQYYSAEDFESIIFLDSETNPQIETTSATINAHTPFDLSNIQGNVTITTAQDLWGTEYNENKNFEITNYIQPNDWLAYSKLELNESSLPIIIPAKSTKYLFIKGKTYDNTPKNQAFSISISNIEFNKDGDASNIKNYNVISAWKEDYPTANAWIEPEDNKCEWLFVPKQIANPRWIKNIDNCDETLWNLWGTTC